MAPSGELSIRGSGDLLHSDRILAYCGILLVAEIFLSLFFVAGTHGLIVPLAKPTTTDFVSFYAAGSLADTGTPQLAYDHAHHHAAEERATEAGIDHNFFYYPPVFLLICAVLGHVPYILAFLAFEFATLALYLTVAYHVLGKSDWGALLPIIAFPAVFWNFGLGQNAFLTAALFGAGTLCIARRPFVAGMLFGALCYKPHFALLIPVALVAGRHWRALVAAAVSVVALCLSSLAVFGWHTWHDFLMAAMASSSVYATGRIPFTGFISPFGAVRQLGGATEWAYAVQAGAILSAAVFVALVWRRQLSLPLRAATLASATLVAAPVALFYDLMLAAVATLWLLRADGEDRLAEWEKIALAGLFLLSLSPRSLAQFSHLPVGPFITLALTALVARKALRSNGMLSSCAIPGTVAITR